MIIWDNSSDKCILASAVSQKGLEFIRALTGEPTLLCLLIENSPEEFIKHIPPELEVAFNRGDGLLVKISGQQDLQ